MAYGKKPNSVQMFLTEEKHKLYSNITPELIQVALKEMYFKDTDNKILDNVNHIPTPEEQIEIDALKSKILSGYMYTIINPCEGAINTRKTNLMTGQGGVIMYIDNCVKGGIPAKHIALAIYVQTDNNGSQCIANVSVTKIKK